MFFGLLCGIVLQLPNALALGELFLANMAIAGKPTMFFLKEIYIDSNGGCLPLLLLDFFRMFLLTVFLMFFAGWFASRDFSKLTDVC